MALRAKKVRIMIRWMHIVFGLIILCYIYSPFHEVVAFQIIMKFGIIPAITFTGLWIWKFKAINRIFNIQDV